MAILVQDNFNRANSTTVLGSPQIGPAPTILTGTCGISSNQAYVPVMGSNGTIAVYECSTVNVDITLKRTSQTTAGGIMFGTVGTLDSWYAFFTNQTGSGDESYLGRICGSSTSFQQVLKGKNGSFVTTASVLRLIHFNGWVEMWCDSTLVVRGFLPEAVTATKHGFRGSLTGQTFDDLTISDAPDISIPTKTGEVREFTFETEDNPPNDSFIYRGRDTKDQDIAGGS